jgi:hypothetical protein
MISIAALLFACRIDVAIARALIEAKTVGQLDAVYRRVPKDDVAMRALYHDRRLKLHPTADEELTFLRTLPTTASEFECIYGLGELYNQGDELTPASDPVYSDFEVAAKLAVKHHTGHDRVLRYILTTWSNAEVGEVSFPELNTMLDGDPEPTADAIRRLPLKEQKDLCGGDMRKRSTKYIVEQCRSEL